MIREQAAALGWFCLAALLATCQHSKPLDDRELGIADRVKLAVDQMKSPDYLVHEVDQSDSLIRLDIILTSAPRQQSELEERTFSALNDLQEIVGKDDRLAVWVYHGEPLTLQGMAFYSSLTETYHFKTEKELR